MSIQQRKKDHVDLTVSGEMNYEQLTGFEQYRFLHNALPEINADEVSTECNFLGQTFSFPLFISSMTGGYAKGGAGNAIIAEFCEAKNLPFGVGSQRVMLENPEETESFSIVRKKAPNAFIAANIGGAQVAGGLPKNSLERLLESIEANAIIVHLNPLQELMQPEGDRNFEGIEDGIGQLVEDSPVPVMVKETGAGISGAVGERLLKLGVTVIDVAGAGGTSWAKVENQRKQNKNPQNVFDDWGIPTLECIRSVHALKERYDFEIIASGGIRGSFDIAKALCLGADFAAAAQPVIKAVVEDGYDGLEKLFKNWQKQLHIILVLLGCMKIDELAPHLLQK